VSSCNDTDVSPDVQSEDVGSVQKVLQKDEERDVLYTSAVRNLASGLKKLSVRSFVREKVNVNASSNFNFRNQNVANVIASGTATINIGEGDEVIASHVPVQFVTIRTEKEHCVTLPCISG